MNELTEYETLQIETVIPYRLFQRQYKLISATKEERTKAVGGDNYRKQRATFKVFYLHFQKTTKSGRIFNKYFVVRSNLLDCFHWDFDETDSTFKHIQ